MQAFPREKRPFGRLLFDYLSAHINFSSSQRVLEVGGGYGYLMRDFLECDADLQATMLDISPVLLDRQRDTLKRWKVDFIEKNIFDCGSDFFMQFDIALLNENCGDFPTAVDVRFDELHNREKNGNSEAGKIYQHICTYSLDVPEHQPFNYNLGAVEAVERLCGAGVPAVYISEHSCEAATPERMKGLVDIRPSGNPERISLKGHDEYTIKFSHLADVARWYGYRVHRGQFIDFIEPEISDELRFIMTSGSLKTDTHETVRQFVEDLVKYEFLVLLAGDDKK